MNPILIRATDADFTTPAAVGAPTGPQIAMTRTAGNTATPSGNAGIWECSPGRFRRQVPQAEFSYFIAGSGSFTPDGGETVSFRTGDSIWFAPDTQGEWDIRETVRKAYLIIG
ncbi:cupin domain-containing protein [Falsirhodobacter xinxiangensis]|nr:cupin domain-containing protein [Rhodobacter xinxiangensis]